MPLVSYGSGKDSCSNSSEFNKTIVCTKLIRLIGAYDQGGGDLTLVGAIEEMTIVDEESRASGTRALVVCDIVRGLKAVQ